MKTHGYVGQVLTALLGGLLLPGPSGSAQEVAFLLNGGQFPEAVRARAQAMDLTAWFEAEGWVLVAAAPLAAVDGEPVDAGRAVAVRLRLLGVDPGSRLEPSDPLPGEIHDLRGADPARWVTHQTAYAAQRWVSAWPGIDVLFSGEDGHLRYDLELAPGADLDRVALACEGALGVGVGPDGALEIETELGVLRQAAPRTWNILPDGSTAPVDCAFRDLGNGLFGFTAPDADPALPLVVDPTIEWATYLGSTGIDYVFDSALAGNGEIVVAGFTSSPAYPVTLGAYDVSFNGTRDALITRLAADGATILSSTFLGGMGNDEARAVDVGASGLIAVGGLSASSGFPTTSPGPGSSFAGGGSLLGCDAFVSVLSADGSALLGSGYVGGSQDDYILAVSIAADDRVYVTGLTQSANLPDTPGAWQGSYGGGGGAGDGWVARIAPQGGSVEALTYLGGTADDVLSALVVGDDGSVTVAGWSSSPNFPVTAGAVQPVKSGFADAVLVTLTPDLAALEYATFLGSSSDDSARALARDDAGRWILAGTTRSASYPVTTGPAWAGGNFTGDAFVTRLSPDASSIEFSRLLGGAGDDTLNRIVPLAGGLLAALGQTASANLPVGADALDASLGGSYDAHLALLDADHGPGDPSLLWSSYLGGSGSEQGVALGVDGASLIASGYTTSSDLPVTVGAYQAIGNGISVWAPDGWVARIDLGLLLPQAQVWADLGFATPGLSGPPEMIAEGSLAPLLGGQLELTGAEPAAHGLLVVSGDAGFQATHGGVCVPFPILVVVPFVADGSGAMDFAFMNPGHLPSGTGVVAQAWMRDAAGPQGWSASNGIQGLVP